MGRRIKLEVDGRLWTATVTSLAIGIGGAAAPCAAGARTLPDGRAYELVSPVDKNGGEVLGSEATSPDGNRVGYYSATGFAGGGANNLLNSYLAQRTATGWVNRPMMPPVEVPNFSLIGTFRPGDFTDDLSTAIVEAQSLGSGEPGFANVMAVSNDGTNRWVSRPTVQGATLSHKVYAGRSGDGTHVVFEASQPFTAATDGSNSQVWEWVDGDVRLASVMPDGSPAPQQGGTVGSGVNSPQFGLAFYGTLLEPTVVSADGRRIFFSLLNDTNSNLFVREDGSRTVEVSLSQRAGSIGDPAPHGGRFAGAARDGSPVFFTSADQLTDDATSGGGLYAYDIDGGTLRFVSSGTTDPSGAQVEAVAQVSADGSHVYFIAQGQLVPGEGTVGGHNLYVADGGGVRFIATLGNDDYSNWQPWTSVTTSRTTPDGEHFIFQSYKRLTAFDNGGHNEIYLYDAGDGSLRCASCGPDGHVAAGDASLLANPIDPALGTSVVAQVGRPRGLTDDGSRVFFQTTDGLVPADGNGRQDVYEYHSGEVALISAGSGGRDSEIVDNTPDGHDVFFMTRDSLLRRDIDAGALDIYDARVGGGFPEPPTQVACEADACQPPGATPPPAAAPASGATGGRANAEKTRAPRMFVRPITRTGRENVIRTGKLTLVVSVEAAGTVTARGKASYGDHRVVSMTSAKATAKKASRLHMHIRLPAAARRQLKHHHRVALSIDVTYNKATRPAHVALTLR